MPTYVIEREMPGAGQMSEQELRSAAQASRDAIAKLSPRIHWLHSYVTGDKIFCVWVAADEQAIADHAELTGFPCTTVRQVASIIDPATAE